MAHSNIGSGDRILSGLAALVERSQKFRNDTPGPVLRKTLGPGTAAPQAQEPGHSVEDSDPPDEPRRHRGPQKKPTKVQISIRLDPDVLDALREGGRGWQSRLNSQLREMLGLGECMAPATEDPVSRDRAKNGETETTEQTVVAIHQFLQDTARRKA